MSPHDNRDLAMERYSAERCGLRKVCHECGEWKDECSCDDDSETEGERWNIARRERIMASARCEWMGVAMRDANELGGPDGAQAWEAIFWLEEQR